MPALRNLECFVALSSGDMHLPEYNVHYQDSSVKCYIATPTTDVPFTVGLRARGYHAPGLAVFVFIDGEYQCNRNQPTSADITLLSASRSVSTEITLRQKEEKLPDGTFVGRGWTCMQFQESHLGSEKEDVEKGKIEVIVLRCHYNDEKQTHPIAQNPPLAKKSKQSTAVKKNKSSAEEPDADFGLMLGLFDGPADFDPHSGRQQSQYYASAYHNHPGMQYAAAQHAAQDGHYYGTPLYPAMTHQPYGWYAATGMQDDRAQYRTTSWGSSKWLAEAVVILQGLKEELGNAKIDYEEVISHMCKHDILHDVDFSDLRRSDIDKIRRALRSERRKSRQYKTKHRTPRRRSQSHSDASSGDSGRESHTKGQKGEDAGSHKQKEDDAKANDWGAWATQSQIKTQDEAPAGDWPDTSGTQQVADWNVDSPLEHESKEHEKQTSSGLHKDAGWTTASKDSQRSSSGVSHQSSSSSSSCTIIKPYWSRWRTVGDKDAALKRPFQQPRSRNAFVFPALSPPERRLKDKAECARGMQVGQGAAYQHKARRPVYIDSMDAPYAVFTFRYCSRAKLEELLGRKLKDDYGALVNEAERLHLMNLSKEDIVDELVKMRMADGKRAASESKGTRSEAKHSWANSSDGRDEPSRRKTSKAGKSKAKGKASTQGFVADTKVGEKPVW